MNDIRQKLNVIDGQQAGWPRRCEQIISTCPMAFAAAGLIAGILMQTKVDLSNVVWIVILVLFAAAAVLIFAAQGRAGCDSRPTLLLGFCVFICFACLGAFRLTDYYQPAPNDIRNFIADEAKLATIRGLIITKPYTKDPCQWKFARFKYGDPASSFYIRADEVKTVSGWSKAEGVVLVHVDEAVPDLKTGDYVQMYCWLEGFRHSTNPGQFDVAEYMKMQSCFVSASVKSRDGIERLGDNPAGIFTRIKEKMRDLAVRALLGGPYPENQNERLLQALVLGYKAEMGSDVYMAFRRTGLLHFVCLSGMNFGILIGIIWWLCRPVGLLNRGRAVICLIAAALFLLVVPPNPPAFRAAIMCSVYCASFLFRRRSNPFNAMALAAVILLMIKPTDLFDAGWQLSFAAVLGLLLFTDRIVLFLYEKITGYRRAKKIPKTKMLFRIIPRPGPWVLNIFAMSIAAQIGSAGIILYHFYRIQYLTSIWTVIVSPLIGVISMLGYVKLMFSPIVPSLGAVLDVIISPLSDFLIWIVKLIAGWNISEVIIGKVNGVVIVLFYAAVIFTAFVHFRRPLLKKTICMAAFLGIIVFLGGVKWQRTHPDNLIMTCLDVGHGQAIVAQLPDGAVVLFDAGSLHTDNVGGRIVAAFLDVSGISKIDAIVISHGDIDHINGIPEVVENTKTGGVYANEAFTEQANPSAAVKFLNGWLAERKLAIWSLDGELKLNSRAKVKIIWPGEQMCRQGGFTANDKSAVCLIEFGKRKILLCSDIEKPAQKEILRFAPDLKADVVVAPHHGSTRTSDADFLEKLGPVISIVSCGRKDYERQRTTRVENKARSFYTAKDGSVTICISEKGLIKAEMFAK